ncbi:MAG TPA: hypothetical protein VFS21_03380 [Roseiflexaceae bacterium]|nr:hypothetical protein [Roseiflexaceae bacterium]
MRSIDIPQANQIARVLAALAALGDGCATAAQIAVALGGLDPRHGDYYLHALRILGLADYAGGQALRTTLGAQLAALPAEAQRLRLRVLVAGTSPMREVLAAIDAAAPAGCTLDELATLVQRLAPLSAATARRRAQAMLAWLHDLQLAAPAGGRWRRVVDQQLEESDPAVAVWLRECGVAR